MFSYQGSCRSFQATALIFYQISFRLSRTFFFFSPVLSALFRSASSDSLYRLSHLQGAVNNFFQVIFDVLSRPFPGQIFPSFQRFRLFSPALLLPGRSASASPAELIPGSFKFPSSATGAILSLQEGIVNVFSVFYLFQTIRAIQYYQTLLTFHLYLSELYLLPTENQLKKMICTAHFWSIQIIFLSFFHYFIWIVNFFFFL